MAGEFPLPSHLSKMMSVIFKVPKKVILFTSGERKSLYKPSGHGLEGNGAMKLSMSDQLFCSVCTTKIQLDLCTATLTNSTNS